MKLTEAFEFRGQIQLVEVDGDVFQIGEIEVVELELEVEIVGIELEVVDLDLDVSEDADTPLRVLVVAVVVSVEVHLEEAALVAVGFDREDVRVPEDVLAFVRVVRVQSEETALAVQLDHLPVAVGLDHDRSVRATVSVPAVEAKRTVFVVRFPHEDAVVFVVMLLVRVAVDPEHVLAVAADLRAEVDDDSLVAVVVAITLEPEAVALALALRLRLSLGLGLSAREVVALGAHTPS